MISIEDRTEWAKAEARAKEIKPLVKVIKFGEYEVASSDPKNKPYTVKFEKSTTGHWAATCTCKAHVGSDKLTAEQRAKYTPKRCFHIVSAYASHRIQVNIRKDVRAALEAVPASGPVCVDCGADAGVWTGSEWLCWPHLHERAAAEKQAEFERLYADLIPSFSDAAPALPVAQPVEYTEAQADYDRACLFG